jgi:nucleoside-diphosphate-sugar epimerase
MTPRGAAFCWGHVEDTARAHILAMEQGQPGESYIIAGPVHTLAEGLALAEQITGIPAPRMQVNSGVVQALANVAGLVERVVPLPEMYSAETLRSSAATYIASNDRAQRELGFTPRPLEEGLRETLRYEMERLGMPVKAEK